MIFRMLLLAASVVCVSTAQAGLISSGGGKIIGTANNPWFVGRNAATYCVEKSNDYSQSEDAAVAEVEAAAKEWMRTLRELVLNKNKPSLTITLNRHHKCTPQTDLRILLGVMNDDVRQTIADAGDGYVGFAKRTTYDESMMWGRGYIWIAPDLGPHSYKKANRPSWNQGMFTYFVLLHEIGHVFGFQHHMGNLMQESAPETIADMYLNGGASRLPLPKGGDLRNLPAGVLVPSLLEYSQSQFADNKSKICTFLVEEKQLQEIFPGYKSATGDSLCFHVEVAPDRPDVAAVGKLYLRRKGADLFPAAELLFGSFGTSWSKKDSVVSRLRYAHADGSTFWGDIS